jgi:hypothetical protein
MEKIKKEEANEKRIRKKKRQELAAVLDRSSITAKTSFPLDSRNEQSTLLGRSARLTFNFRSSLLSILPGCFLFYTF